MVIELAWRFFFVNNLTDEDDNLRKVGKREGRDLRSVDGIWGYELRAAGYGERVTGCELRVASCGARVKRAKCKGHSA